MVAAAFTRIRKKKCLTLGDNFKLPKVVKKKKENLSHKNIDITFGKDVMTVKIGDGKLIGSVSFWFFFVCLSLLLLFCRLSEWRDFLEK